MIFLSSQYFCGQHLNIQGNHSLSEKTLSKNIKGELLYIYIKPPPYDYYIQCRKLFDTNHPYFYSPIFLLTNSHKLYDFLFFSRAAYFTLPFLSSRLIKSFEIISDEERCVIIA